MSETEELPMNASETFTNKKELDLAVNSAIVELKKAEADPIAKAGTAAGELGFFAALGEIAKSHMKEGAGVVWKDAKTLGISFIGLVPLARELSGPAKAMREANKIAYYAGKAERGIAKTTSGEKALRAVMEINELSGKETEMLQRAIDALPKGSDAQRRALTAVIEGAGLREALHLAEHGLPPSSFVEKGAAWVKHTALREIPKLVDPFPDVPDAVKKVTGVLDNVSMGSALIALIPPAAPVAAPIAAVSGMIGVGVPAAWQFVHNRFEAISIQSKTEEKVFNLVKDTVKKRLGWTKNPDTTRAAQAFQPAAQPAYS